MTLKQQFSFWIVALVVMTGILFLLSGIMLPFVAGMALAYMLDPLADRLEAMGLSRITATSVIIGVSSLVFIMVIVLIVPIIGRQISQLITVLPGAVNAIETELTTRIDWL